MAEIRFSRRTKVFTALTVVALAVAVFFAAHDVIWPFVWAFVAAYVLNPIIRFLVVRARLPRAAAVALFFVVFLVAIGFGLRVLVPGVNREYREVRRNLPVLASGLEQQALNGQAPVILGVRIDPHVIANQIGQLSDEADAWFSANAYGLGMKLFELSVKLLIFLVSTFYLLLGWERLGTFIRDRTPLQYRAELGVLVQEIDDVLAVYLRGLFVLLALMSVATYIVLEIIRLPYALILGIATGILELVPFVGPYVAAVLAITVALAEGNGLGWSPVTLVVVLALVYLTLRLLEDYLVIPHVIGHAVEVHPLIVLAGVAISADIFGINGAVLAAPALGVLRVLLSWLYRKLLLPAPGDVAEEPLILPPMLAAAAAAEPPLEAAPPTVGRLSGETAPP